MVGGMERILGGIMALFSGGRVPTSTGWLAAKPPARAETRWEGLIDVSYPYPPHSLGRAFSPARKGLYRGWMRLPRAYDGIQRMPSKSLTPMSSTACQGAGAIAPGVMTTVPWCSVFVGLSQVKTTIAPPDDWRAQVGSSHPALAHSDRGRAVEVAGGARQVLQAGGAHSMLRPGRVCRERQQRAIGRPGGAPRGEIAVQVERPRASSRDRQAVVRRRRDNAAILVQSVLIGQPATVGRAGGPAIAYNRGEGSHRTRSSPARGCPPAYHRTATRHLATNPARRSRRNPRPQAMGGRLYGQASRRHPS